MDSKFIEMEFGRIHYSISSTNHPYTILFLHSFHSSAAAFYHVNNHLKNQFNIVCLDFQGHGLSSHIQNEKFFSFYSVDGTAKVLLEFLNHANLTNFVIIGNSIGGNAAVRNLANLREVKGLILAGSLQAKTSEEVFNLMYPKAPTDLLFQKNLSNTQIQKLANAYVKPNEEYPHGFDQMVEDIKQTDPNFRKYLGESIPKEKWIDEIQILQNSSAPLMYILGEDDGFINSSEYKKHLIKNGIEETCIKILKESGHCPHLSTPKEFTHCILSFMKKLN